MNVRPSFVDKILARVRIDSASSVALRAFFHSLLESTVISFRRLDDGRWGQRGYRLRLGRGCLASPPPGSSQPSHTASPRRVPRELPTFQWTSGVRIFREQHHHRELQRCWREGVNCAVTPHSGSISCWLLPQHSTGGG